MSSELHLSTPMAKAILKFFHRLERDIAAKKLPSGSVKAYIFGGCAMHILTNSRGSNDIDVEFAFADSINASQLEFDISPISYFAYGVRLQLIYDRTFTPTLGPLHEDYQDDAILLSTTMQPSPLKLYVVSPADLAVSKLGRFGEIDLEDILTLIKTRKLPIEEFIKRANEAAEYYVGNKTVIHGNIKYVVKRAEQLKLC